MSEIFSKILKDKNGKTLNVGSQYNQPDWGSIGEIKELYPEMTLAPMAEDDPTAPIATAPTNMPAIGDTAKIMWNGTEYTCTGAVFSEDGIDAGVMFGNAGAMIEGAAVTSEPFLFVVFLPEIVANMGAYAICVILDGSTSVTFSANIDAETVHKIDEKFLPIQKTHWVNEEDVIIYPETTLTEHSNRMFPVAIRPKAEMTNGTTYKVSFNGTEYDVEALDASDGTGFYSLGMSVPNVFTILFYSEEAVQFYGFYATIEALSGNVSSITFSIIEPQGSAHKIDTKYLPEQLPSANGAKDGSVLSVKSGKWAINSTSLPTNVANGSSTGSVRSTSSIGENDELSYNDDNKYVVLKEKYVPGSYSTAFGHGSAAAGPGSSAIGYKAVAFAEYSFAEGSNTTALGPISHAEGNGTITREDAQFSHVEGRNTIAAGIYQHVQGRYNIEGKEYAHILGNGTENNRSNAHTIDWDGNGWFAGTVEGTALILKSPNGTRYKVTVSDNGTLSAAAL